MVSHHKSFMNSIAQAIDKVYYKSITSMIYNVDCHLHDRKLHLEKNL